MLRLCLDAHRVGYVSFGQGLRLIIDQGFQASSPELLKMNISLLSGIIMIFGGGNVCPLLLCFLDW
ncbi:MAG: hypothetical protein Ct9H300mP8_01220 [Gammaproteobacteria bacterium]|nr:MAG: hypothetical protein Ct9H300mP8_01220 [Gammaproteobacteria bacterium]